MTGKYTLANFYRSKTWCKFRQVLINDRLNSDGLTVCEHCGKEIIKAYDIILHHMEELTEDNVNDSNVSFNPDNIKLVHHKCHNLIHKKLCYKERQVYLVYGSPLSGKSSYVNEVMNEGDLIVDIDLIWKSVSNCEMYVKPNRLKSIVFGIRDYLLDSIKYRRGQWHNAYIVGSYPLIGDRERLCKELCAREVFIDCSKEECIKRLYACADGRIIEEWEKYICDWFENFC